MIYFGSVTACYSCFYLSTTSSTDLNFSKNEIISVQCILGNVCSLGGSKGLQLTNVPIMTKVTVLGELEKGSQLGLV